MPAIAKIFSSLFLICAGFAVEAAAQERSADTIAAGRLFHVEVLGTPRGGERARYGKAFAIAPRLLVAPKSVIGGPEDWEPKALAGDTGQTVMRITKLLDRTIVLRTTTAQPPFTLAEPTDRVIVDGATSDMDAVALLAPDLDVADPFKLSFCGLKVGDDYAAVLVQGDRPADPGSLTKPNFLSVQAEGYRPDKYGNLYVFRPEAGGRIGRGMEGSPILDVNNDVVAMVSAVIGEEGAQILLATPITPQFPGMSGLLALSLRSGDAADAAGGSIQCSLNDTVRKMYDRVAGQLNWTVEARYHSIEQTGRRGPAERTERLEKLAKLLISYDDPSKLQTVREVTVRADYFGVREPGGAIEPIALPRKQDGEANVKKDQEDPWSFDASRLVEVGEQIIEPGLLDGCSSAECGLRRIVLTISPVIDPQVWPELPPDRRLPSVKRTIEWTRGR